MLAAGRKLGRAAYAIAAPMPAAMTVAANPRCGWPPFTSAPPSACPPAAPDVIEVIIQVKASVAEPGGAIFPQLKARPRNVALLYGSILNPLSSLLQTTAAAGSA